MKKNLMNVVLIGLVLVFASCETKRNEDSKDVAEDTNKENLEDSDRPLLQQILILKKIPNLL